MLATLWKTRHTHTLGRHVAFVPLERILDDNRRMSHFLQGSCGLLFGPHCLGNGLNAAFWGVTFEMWPPLTQPSVFANVECFAILLCVSLYPECHGY